MDGGEGAAVAALRGLIDWRSPGMVAGWRRWENVC